MPQYKELGIKEVSITEATIMQPIDIQSRFSQTIQTHNAVSVAAGATNTSVTWVDCAGFDSVSVTLLNEAVVISNGSISWSHDGNNTHGIETIMTNNTDRYRVTRTTVKARYAKLNIQNSDTSARTMSTWLYLIT